ncbi:MAG: aryl-sulfate sulfotransferase [Candidatus Bathyarchaeia archaeon]
MLPVASQGFVLPCTITTSGNAWNGEVAFGLWQATAANGSIGSYLIVMKTDGTVEYVRQSNYPAPNYEVAKNIAQNTLLYQGDPPVGGSDTSVLLTTHIWSYVTNTTVDFPSVIGHHDIEYNPINNTFLTLQEYLNPVNGTPTLFDTIVELDAQGNILWSWDVGAHIPLSEADPYGPTTIFNGTTVSDFTHSNALQWDYNNNIVYLNCRHINTFYKINMTTGNLIWACGEYGNFTLLSENGTQVKSLWYHSHGTFQIAPDIFEMFDNDFANETNPNDCRSRMIELALNETSMTAYVNWEWDAPPPYWSYALGNTAVLPNGDRMGVFGVPSHQRPENAPWSFNDTGAVIVEVDPAGNVVRTYTFPVGWAIYRVQPLIHPTMAPSPAPTTTPTASPTFSPSPTQVPPIPAFPKETAFWMLLATGIATVAVAVGFRGKAKNRLKPSCPA